MGQELTPHRPGFYSLANLLTECTDVAVREYNKQQAMVRRAGLRGREAEQQGAMLMKSLSCDEDAAATKELGFIGVAQEILETIGDGFCAIDGQWNIVYVNLRACEMWGLAADRLIGRVFWNVFPQMIGTDGEERLRRAIKAGSRVEYEAISPILTCWLWVRVCPMSNGLIGLY